METNPKENTGLSKPTKLRIKGHHRRRLEYYLKEFYKYYPNEKYTLFHFVKYFKARLKDNKDAWCGVSGPTGSGKSYFVIAAMILSGRPMTMTDNISYIPKGQEIKKKFDRLKYQPFLVDEAAREMRSVNWQSKQQQGINVLAMTDRFKNNWVFLNMPSFSEFTKSMRVSNLQFRIIVLYRNDKYARVVVQRKSRNWRSEDPWGDEIANNRYEAAEKKHGEINNDMILTIERGLPSTVMDFIVPNLALVLPDVTSEYEKLKLESRIEMSDEEKFKDKWKDKYEEAMSRITKILFADTLGLRKNIKLTKDQLSSALGISKGMFDRFLMKNLERKPQTMNFRKK